MIHDLKRQGLAISEIARRTGLDRKTVRRRLAEGPGAPTHGPRKARPRLIDDYADYPRERVETHPRLSGRRLHREIAELGYACGYTAVTDHLRSVRPRGEQRFQLRFETPPGRQSQADFAHSGTEFSGDPGKPRAVWLFSMVLGRSRRPWGRFCRRQDLPTVLRCHLTAFEAFGGATAEVPCDRMKTAVTGTGADGAPVFNAAPVDLPRHHGAVPRACRPYRPETKGKVARPFSHIRQDFHLGRSFRDLDDLNAQFADWLDTGANLRVHGTTGRAVDEAFADELPSLRPLPRVPHTTPLSVERRVTRDGMVSFGGGLYSVPDGTRSRVVEVQEHAARVRILEDGALVAVHPLLEGGNRRALDPAHRRRRRGAGDAMSAVLEQIQASLVGLRMPHALESLAPIIRRIERGETDTLGTIHELLSGELAFRETRRVGIALRVARLNPPKTPESFDFAFQPSLDRHRVIALAQLDFIDRAETVHFLGPPGTGKSHLARALAVAAVKSGRSVYRTTLAELVDSLAAARRADRLDEKFRHYRRTALPVADEIGYVSIDPQAANLFFQLVNARYGKGAMILTSNKGFAEWGDMFGDPVMATALLDRLPHHATVVRIGGAGYRLREHADLIPEHVRANAPITPPPPPRRRGRPPKSPGVS